MTALYRLAIWILLLAAIAHQLGLTVDRYSQAVALSSQEISR